jgi:hypothetical protein
MYMMTDAWSTERRIGIAGLTAALAGLAALLYLDIVTHSVCGHSGLLWPLVLLSLASLIAVSWAMIKDSWWWAIAVLLSTRFLLSVMGIFKPC